MDQIGIWILFLIFIFLGFLFSYCEKALYLCNSSKLSQLLEENNKENIKLSNLSKERIKKKIALFNIDNIICCIVSSIILSVGLDKLIYQIDSNLFNNNGYINMVIYILSILVSLVLVLIIGCVLPKKLHTQNSEMFLMKRYTIVNAIAMIFAPISRLILFVSTKLAKLFGVKDIYLDEDVTAEEIMSMVDVAEQKGDIQQEESQMINNIFDFDDSCASDLMTHRTDVVAVEVNDKISDIVYYAINKGFSRIPVYENDIDNIKGIIYVKDLLCLVGCANISDFSLSDFIRDTIYVPEAKSCIDLFTLFKEQKAHIAVVVDEYGGTAGIITLEDLLEAIVGNIQDEYDNEAEQISQISENVIVFDGAVDLEDVEEKLSIKIEHEEETTTLGGFIVESIGRVPDDNDHVSVVVDNVKFTTVLIEDRRILKVKAEIL